MTKEQIKKELSTYTKEEIIKAIIATPYVSYKILNYLNDMRTASENKEINKASDAWKKASDEHITYLKYIHKVYGDVNILDLPADVATKLLKLRKAEDLSWKKLNALQDKQEKRFLK